MSVFTGIKEILKEYTNKIRKDCYATCTTTAGTVGKVAILSNCSHFTLEEGVKIKIKFSYENTADSPTLKVQFGTSQETAVVNINKINGDSLCNAWKAGEIVDFIYNGTSWDILSAERLGSLENQVYDFVVTTSTTTTSATGALIANLNNTSRPVVLTGNKTNIRVTFTNSCYSTVARSSESLTYYPKLRVYTSSTTYSDIPIVMSIAGKMTLLPCHKIKAGIATSGSYYFWYNYTTLDLVYRTNVTVYNSSGTSLGSSNVLLVKGNPDVIKYYNTTPVPTAVNKTNFSYVVKADGYTEIWGISRNGASDNLIEFPVEFRNTPVIVGSHQFGSLNTSINCSTAVFPYYVDNTGFKVCAYWSSSYPNTNTNFIAKGY